MTADSLEACDKHLPKHLKYCYILSLRERVHCFGRVGVFWCNWKAVIGPRFPWRDWRLACPLDAGTGAHDQIDNSRVGCRKPESAHADEWGWNPVPRQQGKANEHSASTANAKVSLLEIQHEFKLYMPLTSGSFMSLFFWPDRPHANVGPRIPHPCDLWLTAASASQTWQLLFRCLRTGGRVLMWTWGAAEEEKKCRWKNHLHSAPKLSIDLPFRGQAKCLVYFIS